VYSEEFFPPDIFETLSLTNLFHIYCVHLNSNARLLAGNLASVNMIYLKNDDSAK